MALFEMDSGSARRAADEAPAGRGLQSPPGGIMYTPERTYSLLTLGALALTVVVAFVALVHNFAGVKFVW